MKFLAILLSCYFLGLTFMPCEDTMVVTGDQAKFQQVDHSASSSQADDCSPFCQCHCCHVHITGFENEETELVNLQISSEIPDSIYLLGDDIPMSFFQPPRV